ncbi:PCTP protein [Echinococcus multilocularis]|uniref:START domain-containing protein 10 n=1 Tax=Echinococcus multilocularis TaxID=6211 RepID=A0A068YAM7_ECHMU|nr:PCTP protein [Echinococcus multilocularis]
MASFSVGDVRPASEHDVKVFRNLMDDDSQWRKVFSKKGTVVSMKGSDSSSIHMVKVKTTVIGLSAADLYDTLMDPDYRRAWDKYMVEGYDLCLVSPNTDIGYYLVKSFPPFKHRDSVTLRSWFQFENEYVIMNHSVFHAAAPPRKEYVRAISYLSGYIVRKSGPDSCFFGFVTQSDPRGKFPSWAVNRIAQIIAPKTVSVLIKAARAYPEWKAQNSPTVKPWIFPEQNKLEPLNASDVLSLPDVNIAAVDEDEQRQVTDEAPPLADLGDSTSSLGDFEDDADEKVIKEEAIVPQSAPGPVQQSVTIG